MTICLSLCRYTFLSFQLSLPLPGGINGCLCSCATAEHQDILPLRSLPLHSLLLVLNRHIPSPCHVSYGMCCVAKALYVQMFVRRVLVRVICTHRCLCLMLSVFPRESLVVGSACVGGLVLSVIGTVLRGLSFSPSATYLFVAYLHCIRPDTNVCQQREKQSMGNW